jgi:hypothetical protein
VDKRGPSAAKKTPESATIILYVMSYVNVEGRRSGGKEKKRIDCAITIGHT